LSSFSCTTMHSECLQIDGDIHDDNESRTTESHTWIAFYLACAAVWTAILVTIPVTTTVGPMDYYAGHRNWYTGDDVIRFIEPIGGLLWNSIILYHSGLFAKRLTVLSMLIVGVYLFGCSLYLQGGAFHSAANMFKNALETIQNGRDDDYFDPLAYYMRTVWEHAVAHYIYAVGLLIMHATIAYAYRNVRAPETGMSVLGRILLSVSSAALAYLIFVVALQFPSGTLVGFLYLMLYGMGVVFGYLVYLYRGGERKALIEFGHLPVLHHFAVAYVVSLVALVAWIIYKGGFESRTGN
jgi:hypothetical protein